MRLTADDIADQHLELASDLTGRAGKAAHRFYDAAEAEPDVKAAARMTDMALRCFLAQRLGMKICLQMLEPPKPVAERPDAGEREPPEPRDDDLDPGRERDHERDREGDYEPVSLARFLGTLKSVVRSPEAEAHIPDLLLGLQRDLARAEPALAPAAPAARPAQARARLMTSAAPLRLNLGGPPRKTGPP